MSERQNRVEVRRTALRRVCVFAGSSVGRRSEYAAVAKELGALLGGRGVDLVYGGGRVGLMGVVADAALASGGHVIGVIPRALAVREVVHDGLPDLRIVESMHERKALMSDLSDGFIALPGGWGTLDELFEILTWGQLGIHQKPCGLLNAHGYFDPLLAFVGHAIDEGFVRGEFRPMLAVSSDPAGLLRMLEAYEAPRVGKWAEEERPAP